jgi:hypothetical protein
MVRCDHVITIGQRGSQITKHVRAGGESMQQNYRGGVRLARLAKEQLVIIDRSVAIVDDWHGTPPAALAHPWFWDV